MNIFFIESVLIRRSATGLIPWLIFALTRRPSDPGSLFFVSLRVNSAVVFLILCFLLFFFFFLCFFFFCSFGPVVMWLIVDCRVAIASCIE